MVTIPPDPLDAAGIAGYGLRLRRREITAEAATRAYLERINALDGFLGAFEHVAAEQALAASRAVDGLLAAGVDLGPLMGVPVAVKDLVAVAGMPTWAGSKLDVSDVIGEEGSFVQSLKRAGGIILGKTKTPEFARDGVGINQVRGTPRNPWDADVYRVPGGSSSGSAVAVAAGLCAFAVGTDTTGSVRLPAALCGVFGLKPTRGLWANDGVFPLSPTLDTIGLLTASAADAALVFSALTGRPMPRRHPLRGLRLGKPVNHFFDDLDQAVGRCTLAALAALENAGVELVPIEIPEIVERDKRFRPLVSAELIAVLGRDRFLAGRKTMDPDIWERTAAGLQVPADEVIRLLWRHRHLCRVGLQRMEGLDGWIAPTTHLMPAPVAAIANTEKGRRFVAEIGRNTWPGSVFGLCGTSTPIQSLGSALPVGLQLLCAPNQECKMLSIALALEGLVGLPPRPDLTRFLEAPVGIDESLTV